jgi:drug/metabolite transporter (DMT)-like permease
MSRFLSGNLLLVLSMVCASTSQLLFKIWLTDAAPDGVGPGTLRALMRSRAWPAGAAGAVLLVLGFAAWILCLSRLELSYAYPIACTSVLLVAVLAALVLGEAFTPRMWLGTALILIGVALLTPRA